MKPSIIVWDLETVPDLAGFAAANDLVGKSDVEVREAIGEKFPKHIYHSIVCIGALIAHREPDHWWTRKLPTPENCPMGPEFALGNSTRVSLIAVARPGPSLV
jgi:3'-5' exonuclease